MPQVEEPYNFMANEGAKAADAGWNIVPVMPKGKAPGRYTLSQWQPMAGWTQYCDRPPTSLELEHWAGWSGCGVGIACGRIIGIDIDADDPALAAQLRRITEQQLGQTDLVRHGQANRVMLVYRAVSLLETAGLTAGPWSARGHGTQFVAFGIHPDTKQPYRWEDASPATCRPTCVPQIDQIGLQRAFAAVRAILPPEMLTAPQRRPSSPTDAPGAPLPPCEPAPPCALASALTAIACPSVTYEAWLKVGMALHVGTAGGADGLALWEQWSATDAARYKPGECSRKWRGFGRSRGSNQVGPGTLFEMAMSTGWTPPPGMALTIAQQAVIDADANAGTHPAQGLLDSMAAPAAAPGSGHGHGAGEPPPTGANDNGAAAGAAGPSAFRPLNLDPLTRPRPPAVPFPLDHLPGLWAEWVRNHAALAGTAPDGVAAALLAFAAATIGNARRASPKHGWTEGSALWIMLVGDPGSNKSQAALPVKRLLDRLDRERTQGFDQVRRQWHEASERANIIKRAWDKEAGEAVKAGRDIPPMPAGAHSPGPKPRPPAVIVNDTTGAALAHAMLACPKGLLLFRDELAGWLNSFGRFGDHGERQMWLEAHNGQAFRIDRVSQGGEPLVIDHLTVSVFGGIQPERFREAIAQEPDDGLSGRFLFTFPDPVPPTGESEPFEPIWPLVAFRRLDSLEMACGAPVVMPFDRPAKSFFLDKPDGWQHRAHAAQEAADSPLVKTALGKMRGAAARLALVLQLLDWAASEGDAPAPAEIGLAAVEAATGLIDRYFVPMMHRVYGEATWTADQTATHALARWIARTRPPQFNARRVRWGRDCPAALRRPEAMTAATNALTDAGWLIPAGLREDGPGRPRTDFVVNPALWAALDAQSQAAA